MRISLARQGERLYINGAVLRVDRKVSHSNLLNDATFLLEAHVMNVSDVTTPLRQLYFITQIMLMNPADTPAAAEMFAQAIRNNRKIFAESADFVWPRFGRTTCRGKSEVRCIESHSHIAADRG